MATFISAILLKNNSWELGKIKLKKGGGDGGHNGLKSIIKLIGSEFNRIRVGIGRPEKISVSSYVLNNFREEEVPLLKKIILKSCEGINLLIANEGEECRRLFSKTIA
jgi:PTH1 family peptidyl-tRNA hydrolase